MTDLIIDRLLIKLHDILPGREAQELMAPSVRLAGENYPDPNFSRPSGVLILLYPNNGQLATIFIERTDFGPHAGQISLPGGKMEENDPDIEATALREAMEEIGIDKTKIEVIGKLTPLFVPHSNFCIVPIVGFQKEIPILQKNEDEVQSIIRINLVDLFDKKKRGVKTMVKDNYTINAPYYNAFGHVIWGATAMIISELEVLLL